MFRRGDATPKLVRIQNDHCLKFFLLLKRFALFHPIVRTDFELINFNLWAKYTYLHENCAFV